MQFTPEECAALSAIEAAAAEFLLGKAESRRIEQAEAELNQREREWRWA